MTSSRNSRLTSSLSFSGLYRNLQQFTHLLSTILLKEYTSKPSPPVTGRGVSNLPANCVLQQVLNVQRLVYDFFTSLDLNRVLGSGLEGRSNCDRNRIIEELLGSSQKGFQRYRCGATALDCSLMITFQRLPVAAQSSTIDEALGDKFVVQQDNIRFMTKIAIMDLDPKPFTHAVKYVEQTQASYLQTKCSQSIL